MTAYFDTAVGWPILKNNSRNILKIGDIVHIHGYNWSSRLIRFMERGPKEDLSWASHTAIVIWVGDKISLVNTGSRVYVSDLFSYEGKADIVITSMQNLSDMKRLHIAKEAADYLDKRYGWWKLIPHVLDWMFGSVYFFRRLLHNDNYPICSWVVAWSYKKVLNYKFGVPPNIAQPDDILDFCLRKAKVFKTNEWRKSWVSSNRTNTDLSLLQSRG